MDFKIVKLKIVRKNILAKWKCPNYGRLNSEQLEVKKNNFQRYDDPQKVVLHCGGCSKHFNGELV